MKVLIISGGTGSRALQSGLHDTFGDSIDVSLLVNYYDNGLSTGVVRKVYNGKILGPSDLRKNQLFRHELLFGHSKLKAFLEHRFTAPTHEAKAYVMEKYNNYMSEKSDDYDISQNDEPMLQGILHYFKQPESMLVDYNDFAIGNIVYAGLAGLNGNSLIDAGKAMAPVLGIDENYVIGTSDESLFLHAQTQSGKILYDEGDIVDWNNPDDPIINIFFEDSAGREDLPTLTQEAYDAILQADMIIFSSGTQWSSLIPTYMTLGFLDALRDSHAKMYLVMNNVEDRDMKGVSSDKILDVLQEFIPMYNITTVMNDLAVDSMKIKHATLPCISSNLSNNAGSKIHDPMKLVAFIFEDYYKDYIDSDVFLFDYDDTIVARGNELMKISTSNQRHLSRLTADKFAVVTGNSVKAIQPACDKQVVYADGGVNRYRNKHDFDDVDNWGFSLERRYNFEECLDKSMTFSESEVEHLMDILSQLGFSSSKIQNRGNAIISIKPIEQDSREVIVSLLKIHPMFQKYTVKATGRTTIDIFKNNLAKTVILQDFQGKKITYVGDEGDVDGNDWPFLALTLTGSFPHIKFLGVENVRDTNIFLRVLTGKMNREEHAKKFPNLQSVSASKFAVVA